MLHKSNTKKFRNKKFFPAVDQISLTVDDGTIRKEISLFGFSFKQPYMRINMKKLALMAASALVLASAANAAMEGKHFTGFYVGGHLGYGSGKSEWSQKETRALPLAQASHKTDLGTRGILGGLHVGFGKEMGNKLYLGLEAFGNLSKTEGKTDSTVGNDNLRTKATRKHEFGVALRPGFVCGNALLYVKAGISSAKWQYRTNFASTGVAEAHNGNTSKHRMGFVPGLGVAFMATDHVMVGLEATHTMFKKQSTSTRVANGTVAYKGKVKSHVTDFTGRVSYKW